MVFYQTVVKKPFLFSCALWVANLINSSDHELVSRQLALTSNAISKRVSLVIRVVCDDSGASDLVWYGRCMIDQFKLCWATLVLVMPGESHAC